jgi:Rps23 Pro-64 3,4-dihydroxylase Tpa1-like proline 4-hydroxylase
MTTTSLSIPSSAQLPFSHVLSKSSLHFHAESMEKLKQQGYLVIDHALPYSCTKGIKEEILYLDELSLLHNNSTAYVQKHEEGQRAVISSLFPKPHIYETELLPNILPLTPILNDIQTQLIPHLERIFQRYLPELEIFSGSTAIKVQINRSLGAFNYHYDSPGGKKDTRRLTCLLYLNEEYTESDGGQIKLQPFLSSAVEIVPSFNRMVLFRSDVMLHRVLTALKHRVCMTIWFHGKSEEEQAINDQMLIPKHAAHSQNSAQDELEQDYIDSMLKFLKYPAYQRSLSKCIYFDEWKESIGAAHAGSGDVQLIQSLEADVKRLLQLNHVGSLVPMLMQLQQTKPTHTVPALTSTQLMQQHEESERAYERYLCEQAELAAEKPLELDVPSNQISFLDFL